LRHEHDNSESLVSHCTSHLALQKAPAIHVAVCQLNRRARWRSEREGAFDAAFVLGDGFAEAAVIVEPERGALDADHIDARRDIGDDIVGSGHDTEGADARRVAFEARQERRDRRRGFVL
jgi:hypothetical protein